MKRKHKVLSWWATILLVIAGFLLIGGVTALTLFLLGRFEKEIVRPQDMSFAQQVDGSGYFDESGNLRVASDFYITLSTTTENVTETEVDLFLDGVRGKTVNDVLSIPEKVQLNKPFKVTLVTDEATGLAKGGTTTIEAVSENVTLDHKKVKVFVDKPLQEDGFSVSLDSQSNDIVLGSTFKLTTSYTSEENKKAFSSDDEKLVFFVNTNEYIDYDWENERFVTKKVSGDSYDEITVYAFANAFFQKEVLDRFERYKDDPEALSSAVTNYLRTPSINEGETTYFTKSIKVFVRDAKVSQVNFSNLATTFQGMCDKFFTLTTRSANGDGSLGATIKEDDRDANLDGLLSRLGIKIPKQDKLKIDNRQISNLDLAGKVIKVVKKSGEEAGAAPTYEITQEDFDFSRYSEYVNAPEGTDYYLLPCTATDSPTDFYWRIAAEEANTYELCINFFAEKSDGTIEAFFDLSQESDAQKIKFRADNHKEEVAMWKDSTAINMEIRFDDNGGTISDTVDLTDFFGSIPTGNVYTRTKFFLYSSSNDNLDEIPNAFNVKEGVVYDNDFAGDPLSIWGREGTGEGYTLFELLDENLLIAKKSISGQVSVLIAIVRTDANQNILFDETGKYQIVNLSALKTVNVDSALSIALMDPTFEFTENFDVNENEEKLYIPAVHRDEDGNRARVLNLNLKYNCSESDPTLLAADATRILNAFANGSIQIVCADKQLIEYSRQYVRLNGQPTEYFVTEGGLESSDPLDRKQTLYFHAELVIEESLFAATASADGVVVNELEIHLLLKYNDGQDTHQKQVTHTGKQQDAKTKDCFVVYYQIPNQMNAAFTKDEKIKGATQIEIAIGQNDGSDNDIQMTWGEFTYPEGMETATIQGMINILNDKLKVDLVDQHGKPIDSNAGIYRVVYSQDNAQHIIVFEDTKTQSRITNFRESGESKLSMKVIDGSNHEYLAPIEINFTIKAAGVSKIEREKDGKIFTEDVVGADRYVDNNDTGRVTISKELVPDTDKLDLTKLVKVYLGDSQTEYTNGMKIQLSEAFVNNLSSDSSKALAKMFKFTENEDDTDITSGENSDMKTFLNKSLHSLTVLYPLNDNTTLEFVVSDRDGSRFNIPVTLILKKQTDIGIGFETYNEAMDYSKYLVGYENFLTLFADEEYDLKDLFPFTNTIVGTYDWNGDNAKLTVYTSETDKNSLISVDGGKLKIGAVYRFTTIQIAIYYGVESQFALNTNRLTLYLNPNILIVEQVSEGAERPFLDLETINSAELSDNFEFYRATKYIEAKGNVESLQDSDKIKLQELAGLKFTNNTPNENSQDRKIVEIGTRKSGASDKLIYLFADGNKSLRLELGQEIVQTFTIALNNDSLAAIRVQKTKDEDKIVLCEKDDGVKISLGIGFGKNQSEMVKKIFSSDDIQVVQYKIREGGIDALKTFVLMTSGHNYSIASGYEFSSSSGRVTASTSSGANGLHVSEPQKIFDENNSITLTTNPKDANSGQATIYLTIRAIVSRIGGKFVYYAENGEYAPSGTAENFNKFADAEFGALLADPASVEAFQKLYAGQTYTLLHLIRDDSGSTDKGVYGFYLDYFASGQNDKSSTLNFAWVAYQMVDGKKVELNETGDLITRVGDTFDFTLSHLASKYEQLFVEFTVSLKVQNIAETYSWKYRVLVVPDFTSKDVTYPFAEDAEYLDELSNAFVENDSEGHEKYALNLNETFGETNSNGKNANGVRFAEPQVIDGVYAAPGSSVGGAPAIVGTYFVASATADGEDILDPTNNAYFSYILSGANLEIVLKQNVALTIVVKKTYTIDNLTAFGGEQEYELRFGQGSVYKHTVLHKVGESNVELRAESDGKYHETVKAGSGESVFTIELSKGSPITSPVDEYSFFIQAQNDASLADALQTLDGGVYAKLEADSSDSLKKLLTLKPKDNIEKDVTLEICFFTDERIALRIELFVTSFYEITINNVDGEQNHEFIGGNTYDFIGNEGIFKTIVDTSDGANTSVSLNGTYSMTLTSAEEDSTVTLQDKDVEKDSLWKVTGNQIEFAHLPQDISFKFTARITKNSQSYSFDFEITVKKSINLANSDYYRVDQASKLYGGLTYNLYIGSASSSKKLTDLENVLDNIYYMTNKNQTLRRGNSGKFAFVVNGEELDNTTLAVRSVAENEEFTYNVFTIRYSFNENSYSLDLALRFCYSILPSVTTNLHTPAPDGKTYSGAEYLEVSEIATGTWKTKTFNNFFTSPVEDFAMKKSASATYNRVEVAPVAAINDVASSLDLEWKIDIKEISNVSLQVGGAAAIVTTTAKTLIDHAVVASEAKWRASGSSGGTYANYLNSQIGLHLTFALIDSASDGTVEFGIYVNSVGGKLENEVSNYKVQILHAGASVVSVVTNPTNYEGNHETIYAEDLAIYQSKALFDENRILQFNPKVSGQQNWDFVNDENIVKTIEVNIDQSQVGKIVNVDVGEDMAGYSFKETETSSLEQTFNTAPIFTSRLVAKYARGTQNEKTILLNNQMNFVLAKIVGTDENGPILAQKGGKTDWQKYNAITLGEADLKNETKFQVAISKNINSIREDELIAANSQYAFYLDLDFEVKNVAENAKNYNVVDLIAGNTYCLLGSDATASLNNQIHIHSTRRDVDYTTEMMEENAGDFDIQIYGFAKTPILFMDSGSVTTRQSGLSSPYTKNSRAETLALVAGQIHDDLRKTKYKAADGDWSYYTGLTPNAQMSGLNTAQDVNTYNYLVLLGDIDGGKEHDYDILAQGCNNDGNHVMVKVIYTVDIGNGQMISQENNLMFRVIPNAMNGNNMSDFSTSNLSFRTKLANGSASPTSTDYDHTFGNGKQRIASNYDNIFEISISEIAQNKSFNLYKTDDDGLDVSATTAAKSVVLAQIYGKSDKNYATEFDFSYDDNSVVELDNVTYNNFADFVSGNLKLDTSSGKTCSFDISKGTKIALGERYFYIDFTNDFGFAGRFFFKIVAASNPYIKSMSDTVLKEDEAISIGAEFTVVDNVKSDDGYYAVESFTLDRKYLLHDDGTAEEDLTGEIVDRKPVGSEGKYSPVWNNGINFKSTNSLTIQHVRIELKLASGITVGGDGDSEQVTSLSRKIDVSSGQLNNGNGVNISIFTKDTKWDYSKISGTTGQKDFKSEDGIMDETAFEQVEGATITVFLDFREKTVKGIEKLEIKNLWQGAEEKSAKGKDGSPASPVALSLQYHNQGIHQPAFLRKEGEKKANVTLTNITAYGFQIKQKVENSTTLSDINSKKLVDANSEYSNSDIDTIKVKGVEFFYNGEKIGTASGSEEKAIVTDEQYTFWRGTSAVASVGDSATGQYRVPKVTSKLFGTSLTLNDVTMKIIVTDGTDDAELDWTVSITRDDIDLFGAEGKTKEIADGDKPNVTASGLNVKNDTLEVVLDPGESTTFFIYDAVIDLNNNDEIYENGSSISITHNSSTKTGSTITLTNNRDYTYTEYLSLNNNRVGGAEDKEYMSNFYIYEIVDTGNKAQEVTDKHEEMFLYNGSTLTVTKIEKTTTALVGGLEDVHYEIKSSGTSKPIAQLTSNALRMYLPSINALSQGSLTKTLYFLYNRTSETGYVYQYKQDFKILPKFDTATRGNNGLSGDTIEVKDYVEVSNSNEKFYYIPLNSWAGALEEKVSSSGKKTSYNGDISLTPNASSDGNQKLVNLPLNMFTFAIESDGSAGGSAFIDEYGMITTSKNFAIESHIVTVKVYMKASGYDESFEEDNSSRLLGKFTIRLVANSLSSSSRSAGVYYSNDGVITIPTGFSVKGSVPTSSLNLASSGVSTSFACEKGVSVDLKSILDKSTDSTISNRKYHIVSENYTSGNTNLIYCADNINHWTFTTAGIKTVKLVMTGRRGSSLIQPTVVTCNVMVYDNSTREENAYGVQLNGGTTSGNASFALNTLFDGADKWYALDESANALTEVTGTSKSLSLNASEGLVQEKTLVATYAESGETKQKTFRVTFYLYSPVDSEKSVALFPSTNFDLRNLVETESGKIYQFHELGTKDIVKNDNATYSTNNSYSQPSFVVVIKNAGTGEIEKVEKQTVTFKIINTNLDMTSGCFAYKSNSAEKWTISSETIKSKVQEMFGLSSLTYQKDEQNESTDNYYIVQVRDSATGLLTSLDTNFEVSTKATFLAQEFIVTYKKSGVKTIKRALINLHLHENASRTTVSETVAEEHAIYYLRDANRTVLSAIGGGYDASKVTVAYYQIDEKTGARSLIESVLNLEHGNNFEKDLFVEIIDNEGTPHGYYIHLKLSVAA